MFVLVQQGKIIFECLVLSYHHLKSEVKELMSLFTLGFMKWFSMASYSGTQPQYFGSFACSLFLVSSSVCSPLRSTPGLTSACPSCRAVGSGGSDCGQSGIGQVLIHQLQSGEKESGKEKMSLVKYPAAGQDGGDCSFSLRVLEEMISFYKGLPRVPAGRVAYCRCVFSCCRELWAREHKALPQSLCHMSYGHVLPCTQLPLSILAELDWVVSHCPLYLSYPSLAGLIWKDGSHSQTQKE